MKWGFFYMQFSVIKRRAAIVLKQRSLNFEKLKEIKTFVASVQLKIQHKNIATVCGAFQMSLSFV